MAVVIAVISTALIIALTPAGNLYAGDLAIEKGHWDIAIKYFNNALDSNQLNKPARIIVYWNLHIAYENINDIDNSAQSLLSYIAYSTDFLNSLFEIRPKGEVMIINLKLQLLDWARREKVRERLDLAKIKLDHYWNIRKNRIRKL